MALGPAFSSDRQAFGLPSLTSERDARWNEWRTRYREIGPEDLRAAGARPQEAAAFAAPLNLAMKKFDISNTARQAAFLANVAQETSDGQRHMLRAFAEDPTFYTVELMRKVFKRRFRTDAAIKSVLRDPRDIDHPRKRNVVDPVRFFNHVYGGNKDVGNRPDTDDGYKYRGRGALGLTGYGRYLACGAALGVDLVAKPDLVSEPFYACLTAAWAWSKAAFLQVGGGEKTPINLNLIADRDTSGAFDQTCAGVNYGDIDAKNARGQHVTINGLALRRYYWPKFRHALHLRDLRLFHERMAGVPARANLFDDFRRPTTNDDGARTRFLRDSTRVRASPR
jgi:putative chitinase